MRLIDADEAIKRQWYGNANPIIYRQYAVSVIENAPTVEAAVLPCKMGDTVWGIRDYNGRKLVLSGKVYQMFFGEDMRLCISIKGVCRGEWGKKVFATKEDAEKALGGNEDGVAKD